MQMFGEQKKSDNTNSDTENDQHIEVMKASSLALGTHTVRFYPLSAEYAQGANYPVILQNVHWLNRRPIICRRTSYDYTVPETQNKPKIDSSYSSCVICTEKFNFYKKAKPFKEINTEEYKRLRAYGQELQERTLAASIVSFVDKNNQLSTPVVLRFGIELLTQIEFNANRIELSSGINICDPVKGYLFDIIIGTNKGGWRSYENSMPAEGNNGRICMDITKNYPWKWNEICEVIKNEIKPIPTQEEVKSAYLSYLDSGSEQEYLHPALRDSTQNSSSITKHEKEEVLKVGPVSSYKSEINTESPTPATNVLAHALSNAGNAKETIHPCHSQVPNGSGYDPQDNNCKSCSQMDSCSNSGSVKVKPGSFPNKSVNTLNSEEISKDVSNKLKDLSERMLNDG